MVLIFLFFILIYNLNITKIFIVCMYVCNCNPVKKEDVYLRDKLTE